MSNPKYRNRDWLYTEYYKNGRSVTDIADEIGVDHTTISKWRRKLEIPKPSKSIEMECPVCGDEFERYESKVERTKHTPVCSRECIYEGRSKGIIGREVENGCDIPEESLERIKVDCKICENTFEISPSRNEDSKRGKYCSRECFEKAHSKTMSGEGNPMYVDGSSFGKRCYRGSNWNRLRKKVYERDDYECQKCGVKCVGRKNLNDKNGSKLIQAHHIEEYKRQENNDMDNLVTLCASCHASIENGGEEL